MKKQIGLLLALCLMTAHGTSVSGSDITYVEDHIGSLYYEVPNIASDQIRENEDSKFYNGDGYIIGTMFTPLDMDVSGTATTAYADAIWCGDGVGILLVTFPKDSSEQMKTTCKEIFEHMGQTVYSEDWTEEPTGITFEGTSSTNDEEPASLISAAGASRETSTGSASTGEANALSRAESYLKFSAFSHEGLVDQLEFEGFSHEEAVYGADHCGADWNEQAAQKAKSYLSFSSFSKSSLIEQLEYEGFTNEQAEYGAEHCGSDWDGSQTGVSAGMENALKKAESYLKYSAFSYEGLVDQLEFEDFSHEEAV